MAGINKVFQFGSFGSLSLVELAGKFSVQFSVNISAGGGADAGIASIVESLSAQVNGAQGIDSLFILAGKKWPQFAAELAVVRPLVDAFIGSL